MEVFDKKVNLTVEEAMEVVKKKITESISGECIDAYQIRENTGSCYVAVFEKYYYRAKNRLTFTVVIDDFSGTTRVHGVGGGGSSGAFFGLTGVRRIALLPVLPLPCDPMKLGNKKVG